jgi:hypothetical protein
MGCVQGGLSRVSGRVADNGRSAHQPGGSSDKTGDGLQGWESHIPTESGTEEVMTAVFWR